MDTIFDNRNLWCRTATVYRNSKRSLRSTILSQIWCNSFHQTL